MKKVVFGKLQIIITITLLIIVAGMAILGVLGFNNTIDYKDSYRLNVKAQDILESSVPTMEKTVDDYLAQNGITVVEKEKLNDGETIVYKLYENVTDHCGAVKVAVDGALVNDGLTCEVECQEFMPSKSNSNIWLLLSAGLAIIAIFVYTFFMEKLAGAVATLGSAVISTILALALVVLTRVPAMSYWIVTIAFSGVLSAILSVGMVARLREAVKNVGNDKLSYAQIAEVETKQSLMRMAFVLGAIVIASAVMIAIGNIKLKFLGIQVLIAGVSGLFSACAWTGIIWALIKNSKKDRKASKIAQ